MLPLPSEPYKITVHDGNYRGNDSLDTKEKRLDFPGKKGRKEERGDGREEKEEKGKEKAKKKRN
jgi:hypothetical protein